MNASALPHGDFPGRDVLTDRIDVAVDAAAGDTSRTVAAIGEVLTALRMQDALTLPSAVAEPHPDHYARRELYRSAAHGYCVVAMTWGPGQATPLHDHAGLWGVVNIWQGHLRITDYSLDRSDGDAAWFTPQVPLTGTAGAIGVVVPPAEYHVIANPSADAIAISVHVYQRAAEACTIFLPQGDGRFLRQLMRLNADR